MHAIVKQVLEISGFKKLNPAQDAAVKAGLLDGKSIVLAAPTASGKTLAAEMAALSTIRKGKKAVYIVPLRALASEKFEDFREKYEPLGIKIAMSVGDMDAAEPWLASNDLLIVTSEKLDSLLRHNVSWIEDIGLVIADEIHLLDSPDRGPTLEVLLTRLRQIANPAILGLSATISNYQELADWLGARAVKCDWRPIPLYRGVCWDGSVEFSPKDRFKINKEKPALIALVEDTLKKGKQSMVFISTRRGAESSAEKIGQHIKESSRELDELSGKVLKALEHTTRQCERLSGCVGNGTAFHHAGLTNKQRSLIENAFKQGLIKVICATPTLAAGINLPAFRVVIRDLKRFSSFKGMDYLPVLEIEQMSGRAGRPKYDTSGEAILLPKNEAEAKFAWDHYIMGKPEKIYSKLGVEPVLRMHVLALVASGAAGTKKGLLDFFFKTFYAHQYKDLSGIQAILEKVLSQLEQYGFIEQSGEASSGSEFRTAASLVATEDAVIKPTVIGRRVSELYIDPLTAHQLIERIARASEKGTNNLGLLHIISDTIEMRPLLNVRQRDMEFINELIVQEEKNLVEPPPDPWRFEYDIFLKAIKTAALFQAWSDETGEDLILEKFGVTPGELRARLNRADWLLYSAQELGLLTGQRPVLNDIRKARTRLKYGIKEELMPFVRLKGIGRVKARTIYNGGVQSMADLRKVPLESLARLVGTKTSESIKRQLIT